MNFSFVIPVYGNFQQLNELLVSLQGVSYDEIILIDDCSPDAETKQGLKWWRDSGNNIRLVTNLKNVGFLRTSNIGLGLATGDVVTLISTDVIIETNVSHTLKSIFTENPRRLVGGTVYNGSTGWNHFGSRIFPYAEGWFLSCTNEGWRDLGYFDERFAPNDFEDVDLSTTAIEKGYELYPLLSPYVRHIGAQSIGYNEQREELTKKNRIKFERKWIIGEK